MKRRNETFPPLTHCVWKVEPEINALGGARKWLAAVMPRQEYEGHEKCSG